MSKLTLLHINIIGVVVALVVAVGLFYVLISPAQQQIETNKNSYNGVKARADKYDLNHAAMVKAQNDKRDAELAYGIYERQYMPVIGYKSTRMLTMMQTFWPNHGKSWPERFIKTFRRFMSSQQKINKISWLNPGVLALGPYGPDPNAINAGMLQGDGLGESGALHYAFPMQVRAPNLAAIMKHVRDWNALSGIGVPVVEGLAVEGHAPNMTATYTVSLTIIVHEPIPQAEPRVAGQAGQQGGGMGGGRGGLVGPGGMTGFSGMGGGPSGMSSSMGPPPGMMGGSMSGGPMPAGMSGAGGAPPMMSGGAPMGGGGSMSGGGGGAVRAGTD